MNWRMKLANWVSGGELTFHKNGWARSSALYAEVKDREFRFSAALSSIAYNTCCDGCQEAASVAKEALK